MPHLIFLAILVGSVLFAVCFELIRLRIYRRRRRAELRSKPAEPGWEETLARNVALYRRLPPELRSQLHGLMHIFLDEKTFEGCQGLHVTDEMKLTIAAQACILLLNRDSDIYPTLQTVLIYPHAYIAENVYAGNGLWSDEQTRLGESWHRGALIVTWDHARTTSADPHDGHNVVLHEFAHQLDSEDGPADGAPPLPDHSSYLSWARVCHDEFEHLQDVAEHHRRDVLDSYGATNPAEFFAVATEAFFEKPRALQRKHPALYEEFRSYYRMDPAAWREEDKP